MIAFNVNSYLFFKKESLLNPLIKQAFFDSLLYHTKNYQGTTTGMFNDKSGTLLYHTKNYQGTTTWLSLMDNPVEIIPYQKLSGNYNRSRDLICLSLNYTIPKTIRELQPAFC